MTEMTTLVFGHKAPDTDSTGSPIIWAWYLSQVRGEAAEPRLLGAPNTEAQFVLRRWGLEQPPLLETLAPGTPVVIVDTNNPGELPDNINEADIRAIIDHHKLAGGLETRVPIEVTMRPLACTATIMVDLMGEDAGRMPEPVRGAALSCILSDTMEFRSPTTTAHDRAVAERLAAELGVSIPDYAAEMFAAKSDISALSDAELLTMDAKVYKVDGKALLVAVHETTSPAAVLARKASLLDAMGPVAAEKGVDEILFFIVDILEGNSTLLIPDETVRRIAERSFGVTVEGDSVVLPGVVSRKKQIVPHLKL